MCSIPALARAVTAGLGRVIASELLETLRTYSKAIAIVCELRKRCDHECSTTWRYFTTFLV